MNTTNKETIKSILNDNGTAKEIREELSERIRFRYQTNLNKMRNGMLNKGRRIVEAEFLTTFKKLDDLGVGTLVIGRKGKPNRFIWHYNLKDIAKAAKTGQSLRDLKAVSLPKKFEKAVEETEKEVLTKSNGTNKEVPALVAQSAVLGKESPQGMSVTIQLPKGTRMEDIGAILDLVRDLGK